MDKKEQILKTKIRRNTLDLVFSTLSIILCIGIYSWISYSIANVIPRTIWYMVMYSLTQLVIVFCIGSVVASLYTLSRDYFRNIRKNSIELKVYRIEKQDNTEDKG
jgi:hypothetical protein